MHPADLSNISNIIEQIRDKGNTVLIVEHDPDLIRIADHVVDLGPGSGFKGGRIMFEGTFKQLQHSKGKTGAYFKTPKKINLNPETASDFIRIKNATKYNLKIVNLAIPKKILTVVTGVAGSGKSTLIGKVLPEQFPETIIIDQSPVAAGSRSNLLTYLGISDQIRKLFASANKVSDKLFSTNIEDACPNCKGLGFEKIDLAFMDDVEQPCEVCKGNGFNPDVLNYHYNNKNIAEVLALSVSDSIDFFKVEMFKSEFRQLIDLGLDYLSLGQRLNTLSGGERQRLKLVKEIDRSGNVIVMDEPSTGLHPADTVKLLGVIRKLIDTGNTVIVIEHNLDIIAEADWIIDIGPGAGKNGGRIIFEGTVSDLLESKESITSKYLDRERFNSK